MSGQALEGIKNKVKEHNEEVGDVASKRTTVATLSKVYERGIGAYKTNPSSKSEPSVSSPEQWAMARVNSFFATLRTGRFRSGKHDTDLLPEGHPLSTKNKEEKAMLKDDRHILNVNETDDSVVIEFSKHHEDAEGEEESKDEMLEERPYHDDEEDRDLDTEMIYRTVDLSRASFIDERNAELELACQANNLWNATLVWRFYLMLKRILIWNL